MAVTRIKNNQITDSTITGTKLVSNTITAGLLENNLTYGSNLTISGNLIVNGTTTTVDTTNTLVADPLLVLSRGETGTPSKDSGFVVERGTSSNAAFIWDESEDEFAAVITSEDGTTSGDVTISSYADIHVGNITSGGTSFTIGNLSLSGNTISSTDTNGDVSIVPNGSGDVNLSADTVVVGDSNTNATVTTNGTGDLILNTNGGTNSGSITIADGVNGNISLSPNGSGEVVLSTLVVSDLTDNRVLIAGTSGAVEDSANLTFDGTTLTVSGNIAVDNVTIDGNTIDTSAGNLSLDSAGGEVTASSLAVSDLTSGRVVFASTSGALTDSANLTWNGTNFGVTGTASVDNITIDGNTIDTSAGNLTLDSTGGEVTATSLAVSDLTSGRVVLAGTSGAIEDSANLTFNGTTLTVTGNVTVDNITIDGDTISSAHTTITIDPSTAGAGGTVVIAGNLQVTGTTTTVESTVVTIADPVFQLGADSADSLDRGIKALYNDGTARVAFFGLDDSADEFVFIHQATDTSSVFSGSLGSAAFGSLRVTDLTDNRVLIAGTSGEIEDSSGLTFDGTDLTASSVKITDLTSGRVVLAGTSGAVEDSANLTFNGTTLTVSGNIAVDNVTIDGNTISTSSGNLSISSTGGEVTVSSLAITDLTSGRIPYVTTSDAITDSANLTYDGTTLTVAGNIAVDNVTVDGNTVSTSAGNLTLDSTGGEVTATSLAVSDLTNTRVVLAGASGALEDSANLTFSSNSLSVTGNVVVDNITLDGNSITSSNALTLDAAASQSIVINEAGADVDVRIEASGEANAIFVEGSTGNVGLGTATPNAGAILTLSSNDSVLVPVGTTLQRPGTPTAGMLRFNSSNTELEYYDGSTWANAAGDFTVITADDFSGDGSTTGFTLSTSSTSAATIISINGVVQDPGTAYSVSGTTLTFTEAPASGDSIDARILTTTTTVSSLTDLNTSFVLDDSAETATTTIDGDVVMVVSNAAVEPGTTNTYSLGTASKLWSVVYANNTNIQNADLAELYAADQEIEPGTVVCFGGDAEVTVCDQDMDTRIAGVVSTDPAHLMNSALESEHTVALALQGRVPCKVVGTVRKGDMMVSAGNGMARAEQSPSLGSVIGKALQNFDGETGVIEVVVGRL